MGQRSQTETLAGVYQAFLQRRTWTQSALAKELEIGVDPLRKILHELLESGMPLSREADHPHVYWSVPKDWFPSSVLFRREEVPELLRQLRRIPLGIGRKRLLELVLSRLPNNEAATTNDVIIPREASTQEEQYLGVVEDAAHTCTALYMRYYTASRGDVGERHVSVHRVFVGPPARFVGTCHRSGTLKTFRVSSIVNARVDDDEPYCDAARTAIDAYCKASLGGFHDGGVPVALSFSVRNPEARWVKINVLEGMQIEELAEGVRIIAHTTAIGWLARFVVGLGGAATPETPALAAEVEALARGALQAVAQGSGRQTKEILADSGKR